MTNRARLIPTRVPDQPEGAVLVLHGGASRRDAMAVSPTQLSVLRMIPIAARIAGAGRGRLAVFRLLNSTRGWDASHTPVDDVSWALGELRERFGGGELRERFGGGELRERLGGGELRERLGGGELRERFGEGGVPFCLVGHSLGGRAALLSAGQAGVRSAVALAPWVYSSDGDAGLPPGRRLLIVHGDRDRIASPERSAHVAEQLRRTADVGYVRVTGGKHAMLKHGSVFDRAAADFATATLLGDEPGPPVSQVLGGESLVEV